jgi:hypothetical protein
MHPVSGSLLPRSSVLAAVLIGAWLSAAALDPPAAGAPRTRCTMAGSIGGPNPAHVGDTVSAAVSVSSGRGSCNATSVSITGGGRVLGSNALPGGTGSCSVSFAAFRGLATVTASLSTGQRLTLGTFTVLDPTPTSTKPPPPTRPPTPTPTRRTTSAAPSVTPSASATSAGVSSSSARPSAPRSSTSRPTRPSTTGRTSARRTVYPWETADPSTDPAAERIDPTATNAAAVGGSTGGGGDPFIPSGLLIGTLVVLAGLVGVAGRLIYLHSRAEVDL